MRCFTPMAYRAYAVAQRFCRTQKTSALASCKALACQNTQPPARSKRAHQSSSRVPSHLKRYASRRDHLCWLVAPRAHSHLPHLSSNNIWPPPRSSSSARTRPTTRTWARTSFSTGTTTARRASAGRSWRTARGPRAWRRTTRPTTRHLARSIASLGRRILAAETLEEAQVHARAAVAAAAPPRGRRRRRARARAPSGASASRSRARALPRGRDPAAPGGRRPGAFERREPPATLPPRDPPRWRAAVTAPAPAPARVATIAPRPVVAKVKRRTAGFDLEGVAGAKKPRGAAALLRRRAAAAADGDARARVAADAAPSGNGTRAPRRRPSIARAPSSGEEARRGLPAPGGADLRARAMGRRSGRRPRHSASGANGLGVGPGASVSKATARPRFDRRVAARTDDARGRSAEVSLVSYRR